MQIFINNVSVSKLVNYSVTRSARRSKKEYNANGDLIIDMVVRKYTVSLSLDGMTETELRSLLTQTEGIFFELTFLSPYEGMITREFYLAEAPAEIEFSSGDSVYYGPQRLVMEER